MAAVYINKREHCFQRSATNLRPIVIGAAILFTQPGALLAQTAAIDAGFAQTCNGQPMEGSVALVTESLQNVRPASGLDGLSKSVAILSGTPSKLDQMRLAQFSGDTANVMIARKLQNVQMPANADCQNVGANSVSSPPPHYDDAVRDKAILGSMSISVQKTPLDRKWAGLSARRSERQIQQTLLTITRRSSGNEAATVATINSWVNNRIKFGEDSDIYRRADYWAPASETLRRGIGDCEDFAIAKMELLSAFGISRDKMRLVIARDLVRNADHAVLVVTLADRSVMLDNVTDKLLDARLPNDYRPIMSFSQNAKWIHGYAAQPVRMASVVPVLQQAADREREVLTVTVVPELPVVSIALLIAPSALPTVL